MGNTVLEAVVAGVTVIANDRVPSFCEHLENLSASYVLRPDPEIIANQIISCNLVNDSNKTVKGTLNTCPIKYRTQLSKEKYKQILEL